MRHARIACGARQIHVLACEGGLERLRGLLRRPEPDPGVALLLDPCWAVHTIGMRYPIDVVFCDARWRVLRVVPALGPRRIACVRGARRVLELGAHTARPLGLVTGVRLQPEPALAAPTEAGAARPSQSAPFDSAPVRALMGLAAVTLLATLLLGGCASSHVAGGASDARGARQPGAMRERPQRPSESRYDARHRPSPAAASIDAAELKLQAEIDYASRAWPLAESAYRELLRQEPRDAEHWRRLGIVFLRTDRASEAVDALGAAARLQAAPDSRTLQNLALAHLRAAADALHRAAAIPSAAIPSAAIASAAIPPGGTLSAPTASAATGLAAPASAATESTARDPAMSDPAAPAGPAAPAALAPGEALRAIARAVEALLPAELRHRRPSSPP